MLAQLVIAVKFREVISWLFIVGSWGHAGFFIAGNFLVTENRELGFFFLSNAKFGGGLLILGLWSLLVAMGMGELEVTPAVFNLAGLVLATNNINPEFF